MVLISHPSGMTPDEERFVTENRSTWLFPKLGLDGDAHLSPPVKKKEKRDGALQASPPWKTPSRSPGQQTQTQQTRKTSPPQGAYKSPKKGLEKENNKGKSDKTEHSPRETQAIVPMPFPP